MFSYAIFAFTEYLCNLNRNKTNRPIKPHAFRENNTNYLKKFKKVIN